MTDDALPEPLVPPDTDLRHFPDMPLQVVRLRDSGLATVADAEVRWANLLSWCVAWHQLPAGSLPDDDARLSHMLGYGRDTRRWRSLRAKGALRGWVKCSDGRLYHPVLSATCLRVAAKSRSSRAAVMRRWDGQATDNAENPAYERNTNKGREGKGRIESSPSPPEEGGEGVSTAAAAEPPAGDGSQGKPKVAKPEIPRSLLLEMLARWNDLARKVAVRGATELTPKREAALRARIRERWSADPLGKWDAYLAAIAKTPFLLGENDRAWRANIDWAIRPDSPVRVAEGKYSDDEGAD
jgi:hypothetical protein